MVSVKHPSKRCLIITVAMLIVIIIAIVVPLAVLLPHKASAQSSQILLPLYIYPENGRSWNPLYQAVESQPDLQFTVIVNPSSGPGTSKFPSQQYASAIKKLSTYPNVEMVGYVRTGYATRNISTVLSEVARYAGWPARSPELAMHGIFFDESPHEFKVGAPRYMRRLNAAVKSSQGLIGDRTVVHNPGVIPDPRFNDDTTDITVVFEQSYQDFKTQQTKLQELDYDRSHQCYMVHSVPSLSQNDLQSFADSLKTYAEFIFLTQNSKNYYESWAKSWPQFVDVMA